MPRYTLIGLIIAVLILGLGAPVSAQFTNEPAGAVLGLDCSFASLSACGIGNPYNVGAIVSDSDPISPPSAYRSRISAGATSGGTQLEYFFQLKPEVYMGMVVRTNPEFQGRTTANKMFFLRGPGVNGFWGLDGAVGSSGGPIYFGHNTASLNNSHACAFDLGLKCNPNVNGVNLIKGQYAVIEAYVKKSTSATSRDGIVRWWVNGILVGNYINLNYAPSGLDTWVWSETWDGTVTNPVPSVNWDWYLGHLRISYPNCVTGCSVTGGGTTPPPPPPAPMPPLGVSNLRFGS